MKDVAGVELKSGDYMVNPYGGEWRICRVLSIEPKGDLGEVLTYMQAGRYSNPTVAFFSGVTIMPYHMKVPRESVMAILKYWNTFYQPGHKKKMPLEFTL